MNLSNAANVTQIVWGLGAFLMTIIGAAKIFFAMKAKLDNLENHTYKRNGGSSMADALFRLEKGLEENTKVTQGISRSLAKLEGRFENHVEEAKN